MGEAWIVAQNIFLIPAISHEADDEVDGKASAANHWLAGQNFGSRTIRVGSIIDFSSDLVTLLSVFQAHVMV